MTHKFTWLLLPSLLLPFSGANAVTRDGKESPAVARLDDIRASLIQQESLKIENGSRSGHRTAQYWPNWGKWPNWSNFWLNR